MTADQANVSNRYAKDDSAGRVDPLAALSETEIRSARDVLVKSYPPGTQLYFKCITLDEPGKVAIMDWWEKKGDRPERRAYSSYYLKNTNKYFEAVVSLETKKIISNVLLGPNVHGPGDGTEIIMLEKLCLEDPSVKAEIAKLGLGDEWTVLSDPWIYGSDGVDDDARQYQCFLYARPTNQPDSNHYSLPLPISPVIDTTTLKVTRIDQMPLGADFTLTKETPKWTLPQPNEYLPELQPSLREDIKPLRITQPEGASFKLTHLPGKTLLSWQKWALEISFDYRSGIILHNIRYDSRPLFYRLSLADMNIPYADPRPPYHKKAAFDLGDVGAGLMANNLQLGCDCLGHIAYLDGLIADDRGEALHLPNAICIHEQDAGVLWKHMNYRTNRSVVARKRELVIQSIITVSNYEYVLNWIFNQAAEVAFEVRLTGILSTQPIGPDVAAPAWGTIVHPQVLATHHQHMFSLRIEPMLDGPRNTLLCEETTALPLDPATNPHGVGFTSSSTPVTTSAGLDLSPDVNRIYKIASASSRNPVNGAPCAYKIQLPPSQPMLAHPTSFHHKRAEFADKALYVVKGGPDRERELYSAGWHTNQSRGGEGVRSWAARRERVEGEDIVLFAQFGVTHVVRAEDFPVMPVETIRMGLKPSNFFERSPAVDVAPSTFAVNGGTLANGKEVAGKVVEEVQRHGQLGREVGLDLKTGEVEVAQGVAAANGTGCCQ